jgi:hypothetical protein
MAVNLDDVLAEREIYRKLVRFAYAMDERDWGLLDDITTDDIEADLGVGRIQGRGALVSLLRRYLDQCGTTQHMLGNVLIEVNGDRATSQAYVADLHLGAHGKEDVTFRTLGRYNDEWIRVEEQWLMCRRVKANRGIVGSMEVFD